MVLFRTDHSKVLWETKNGPSMASLQKPPLGTFIFKSVDIINNVLPVFWHSNLFPQVGGLHVPWLPRPSVRVWTWRIQTLERLGSPRTTAAVRPTCAWHAVAQTGLLPHPRPRPHPRPGSQTQTQTQPWSQTSPGPRSSPRSSSRPRSSPSPSPSPRSRSQGCQQLKETGQPCRWPLPCACSEDHEESSKATVTALPLVCLSLEIKASAPCFDLWPLPRVWFDVFC